MRAVKGSLGHSLNERCRSRKALAWVTGTSRRVSGWAGEKVARSQEHPTRILLGEEALANQSGGGETRTMKTHRIHALVVRHLYLYRRSLPRMMEIFYWPFLDLVIWGFITVYLTKFEGQIPGGVTFFLGALILWDILFRSQQGVTISFLEEIWARNLMNLFASPLKPSEFLAATMVMSLFKVLAVSVVMVVCAGLFYSYNIFVIGLWLIPFVLNLVMTGWIIGVLTTALIMRFGQEAEVLAWSMVFLFQPISCVFYPIEVLPGWLQAIAWMNPAAHVFEGMRAVLSSSVSPIIHLAWATGLNLVLLGLVIAAFHRMFEFCRERGLLVRVGE
jgi:ABC-2 type transport system permease protein